MSSILRLSYSWLHAAATSHLTRRLRRDHRPPCPSCSSDKPSYLEPHLSTLAATDITRNEATLNGIAEIEGDADMPQLYFRYGTTENMDQTVPITTESEKISKQNNVSVRLKNLIASNTYYYMLQGSNGRTITSGNMMNFTTLPNEKPKVGNTTLLSHGPTSAFVSYDILEDGGENITETGCYYESASQSSPETQSEKENMQKEFPGKNATKEILTNYSGGLGQQKLLIGKLTLNTTYKIWPYAKSRMGETIGDCITYTTTNDAIMLQEAGELQFLLGNNLYDYTSLTLAGPMNGDDLNYLRKMMGRNLDETDTPGKLSSIDMTDVKIVAGGGPYGANRYVQDHVIGQGLFANCDYLTNVILPTDVTTIEKDAFMNCKSLAKIEIPASVSNLLPSSGCTALRDIEVSEANSNYSSDNGVLLNAQQTNILWFPMGKQGEYSLPSTITSIGNYAFKECSIETFILPDNMNEIGQGAFMDSKVKEVKLPANLKRIPTSTFQGCKQLKVVRIGSKTEAISDYAFDLCPLTDIYVEAKLPPVCSSHAFTTRGTSFLNTCIVHVPTGKAAFYKGDVIWKQFKNIKSDSSK